MPAKVTLTIVRGAQAGQEFVFAERTTCVLGRAADCSPRLPDDERHRAISRHHCLLDVNPPDVRVRDFGSLNGTFVNGHKIGERAEGQTPEEAARLCFPEHDLHDGDVLELGETVFRVRVEAPAAATEPAARRCGLCGADFDPAPSGRRGERPCAACRADPLRLVRRLLGRAGEGAPELATVRGYDVLRELGRGGMGAVYLARHAGTGEQVALKVMLPRIAAEARAREMFLREVENTRALCHPNVVRLREAGCSGGAFYFTMEYCPGGSVARLQQERGGVLSADEAVPIALQALAGLEYAHQAEVPFFARGDGRFAPGRGLVHRDLKPANLFLGVEGGERVAKVGDYGLAKAFDNAGLSGLTCTGSVMGTPWFMPRQQVVNFKYAQPEVDVWALAASLYFLLTGEPPRDFTGRDPWQAVLQCDPVPIRRRRPAVPDRLARVIDLALTEDPHVTFRTARELRRALEGAL
jgi:hypothetical protein